MTNTAHPVRLTSVDLAAMDAGELREHLAAHIDDTRRGTFRYIDGVAGRISRLTGIDRQEIISNACDDSLAAE